MQLPFYESARRAYMHVGRLIKTVKETIFKAQVYNGGEKTTVKQHKILRGSLSVTANLKFAVAFLRA